MNIEYSVIRLPLIYAEWGGFKRINGKKERLCPKYLTNMKKVVKKESIFKQAIAEESNSEDYEDEEGEYEDGGEQISSLEGDKMESKYNHEYVLAKIKKLQAEAAQHRGVKPPPVGKTPAAGPVRDAPARRGQVVEEDEGEDEDAEYTDEEEEEGDDEEEEDEAEVEEEQLRPVNGRQPQWRAGPAPPGRAPAVSKSQSSLPVKGKENAVPVHVPLGRPQSSYQNKSKAAPVPDYGGVYDARPRTAAGRAAPVYEDEEYDREVVVQEPFRPVYTIAYGEYLIHQKKFNYKQRNFNTIAKKTDRVKRFQQMQNQWSTNKFLSNNTGGKGKEGRKLQLSSGTIKGDGVYTTKYVPGKL
jgi:hypothetical protein